MTRLIWGTLAAVLVILVWYIAADRLTPFTGNARVKTVVTPLVPRVSGAVTEVLVENGQVVEAGAVLARIDPRPYQIVRARAEAELAIATQTVGASSAAVSAAQAKLSRAQSTLETTRLQAERVFALERKGLVALARADEARRQVATAEADLAQAGSDLLRAKEELGSDGQDNPQIQSALAALAQAELDLEWTTIRAPARGLVTNLFIAPGAYATAGQDLMVFLDGRDVRIEAYLTENNLGRAEVGAAVDVVLDMHPGRVIRGQIDSFSAAVSVSGGDRTGTLANAPSTKGFLRDPERFPVRIILPGYEVGREDDDLRLQLNGQADVVMYLGGGLVMNTIASAYIRAVAILSYAY